MQRLYDEGVDMLSSPLVTLCRPQVRGRQCAVKALAI